MRWKAAGFGVVEIDGIAYEHDVVLDRGKVTPRKKKPSKKYRASLGHTPLSLAEEIPWKCRRLVVGTGMNGALPVLPEVLEEAERRHVKVVQLTTQQAVQHLSRAGEGTNAVIHVTC